MYTPLFNSCPLGGRILEFSKPSFSERPASESLKKNNSLLQPQTVEYRSLQTFGKAGARPRLKETPLGCSGNACVPNPLQKKGQGAWKMTLSCTQRSCWVFWKALGFLHLIKGSRNKVMTTEVRYVSAITRTHLRKAPCVPSQIVPVRLLLLSA